MPGQDREGGAFFANNRKQAPNHPDYRGELRLSPEAVASLQQQLANGVQFPVVELSGWKKTSGNGQVFISLQGKKPYEKSGGNYQGNNTGSGAFPPTGGQSYGSAAPQGYGASAGRADLEDDIPF